MRKMRPFDEFDTVSSTRFLLQDAAAAFASSPSSLPAPPPPPARLGIPGLRPGIAVILGVLAVVSSITLLLLLYAKHCKRRGSIDRHFGGGGGGGGVAAAAVPQRYPRALSVADGRRHSGVSRAVVENLPVFPFGALRNQKSGLECAVCLGRFEPAESLRMLPKCRHGFHVECVDTWLEAHSTCPLCRSRVDPEDVLLFLPDMAKSSQDGPDQATTKGFKGIFSGRRVSGRHSTGSVRISICGRSSAAGGSRMSADVASVGCLDVRKDRILLSDSEELDRRFGHRIVVGEEEMAEERWSDLRPADLMFLRSEMIVTDAGRRSSTRTAAGAGRVSVSMPVSGTGIIGSRCLSEITGVSRTTTGRLGSARLGSAREQRLQHKTIKKWLGFAAKDTPEANCEGAPQPDADA